MVRLSLFLALAVASTSAQDKNTQDKIIDVRYSTITIHVGKAGLFSVAGHEHWVSAPISTGVFNDSDRPHVEFKVDAENMSVKPDPKIDADTQAEIQKHMQEMTLESRKYPEIAFRSSRVEKQTEGQWKVEGMLTLHGVTKPIVLSVHRNGDAYAGRATIKQTDFGIEPIRVGGGVIKVKNELEIEFQIMQRQNEAAKRSKPEHASFFTTRIRPRDN